MKTNNQKQVAALDKVLGHCNALGGTYNPSRESIKVTALTSLLTSTEESIQAVDTAKTNLKLAMIDRNTAFSSLPGIGTRILNSLRVTDASPALIANIKQYRDKFRKASRPGQPAPAKPEDSSKDETTTARTSRKPLSQLDFESKISNFGLMIELLKNESLYRPNEAAISIGALQAMLASMRQKLKAVNDARVALTEARLVRNQALYGDNGIVKNIKRVKNYILSVFGATSPQFQMFNSISVRKK